jgi:hypothetical protein
MHLNVHAYTNIVGVCVRTCFRLASLLRCILLQKCGLLLLVCVTTAATATATNAAAYNVVTAIVQRYTMPLLQGTVVQQLLCLKQSGQAVWLRGTLTLSTCLALR